MFILSVGVWAAAAAAANILRVQTRLCRQALETAGARSPERSQLGREKKKGPRRYFKSTTTNHCSKVSRRSGEGEATVGCCG